MRAVFYAGQGGIVSSHALLIERALTGRPVRDRLPVQYGYPGNRTLLLRTKLLTPNTYYDITGNSVHRFWPTHTPRLRAVDDVEAEALEGACAALRHMSQGRAVKMALTSGLDSRTILAVGIQAGIEFEAYTYGDKNNTALDRHFAGDLAAKFGRKHATVPPAP